MKLVRSPLLASFAVVLSASTLLHGQTLDSAGSEAELIAIHESMNIPRGDFEFNGDVMFSDFLSFADRIRSVQPSPDLTYSDGDLNLDGRVDLSDFAIVFHNFGKFGYQPEPPIVPAQANLGLHVTDKLGFVVSSASPVEVGAIELISPSGALTGPESANGPPPFSGQLNLGDPSSVIWMHLVPVTIDGDVITGATATTTADVKLRWFEPGSYTVFTQQLGEGDAITGRPIMEEPFVPPEPPEPQPPVFPQEFGRPIDPPRELLPTASVPLTNAFDAAMSEQDLIDIHMERNLPRGDMDGNGSVDTDDSTLFAIMNYAHPNLTRAFVRAYNRIHGELTPYPSGDLNFDGESGGIEDYAILAANSGKIGFAPNPGPSQYVEVTATVDEDGIVVLHSTGQVDLTAIEFQSSGEDLMPRADFRNEPFDIMVQTDLDKMLFGTLESSVSLNGEFVTNVEVERAPGTELNIKWAQQGSYDVFSSLTRLADIDGSGQVGFTDFLILSNKFGQDVEIGSAGDIDRDGIVAFNDFLILSDEFGAVVGAPIRAAAVPEPEHWFGAPYVVCGCLLSMRRRRIGTLGPHLD